MIAPYVLIVIFYAGYGPRPMIEMQTFNSEATCLAAADHITKNMVGDARPPKIACMRR
jgi:hypothetical protein